MSWLFSRALVEEYSVASCSGGELSALLSANPTPQAFLHSDRMMAFSRPSRFGMTFAPSTESLGAGLLTWFLGAFRARTFQQPERVQGSTASDLDCGGRWRELSVRYDRDSSSWRTHRSLWDEDLSACSLTLPIWGSMRSGVLLERMTPELRTNETGFGLWPTVMAHKHTSNCANPENMVTSNGEPWKPGRKPYDKRTGRQVTTTLHDWLRYYGKQTWPRFVEWWMGWPEGWTDLRPLATDRCRNVQQRHGGF